MMSKHFDETCLGALYMQKFGLVKNLCRFRVVPMCEQVYLFWKGIFLVFSPEAYTGNLKCRNGTRSDLTHLEIHL